MLDLFALNPGPVLRSPIKRSLIAAGLHEFQVFAVRHRISADGKTRYFNALDTEFIVPSEIGRTVARFSERRSPRWNLHESRLWGGAASDRRPRPPGAFFFGGGVGERRGG